MPRLIVTALNDQHRSYFFSDQFVPAGTMWYGRFGDFGALVHRHGNDDPVDIGGVDSGYTFNMVELPPDSVTAPLYAAGEIPHHDAEGFHTTDTVDLVCVIEGRVVSVVDENQVTLGSGDCLIQRGTRHAWRNPGDRPAKMVTVVLNDRGSRK